MYIYSHEKKPVALELSRLILVDVCNEYLTGVDVALLSKQCIMRLRVETIRGMQDIVLTGVLKCSLDAFVGTTGSKRLVTLHQRI